MININDQIALEILTYLQKNSNISGYYEISKHDIAVITFNLTEMERAGILKPKMRRVVLENGVIFNEFEITQIGENFINQRNLNL